MKRWSTGCWQCLLTSNSNKRPPVDSATRSRKSPRRWAQSVQFGGKKAGTFSTSKSPKRTTTNNLCLENNPVGIGGLAAYAIGSARRRERTLREAAAAAYRMQDRRMAYGLAQQR